MSDELRDYLEARRARLMAESADRAAMELASMPLGGGDPYLPPHNGTATSVEAAERIQDSAKADRWRVLRFVVGCGDRGATREEIEMALHMGGSSVRPRVWECVEVEQVRKHFGVSTPLLAAPGHKRLTLSGSKAFVLLATLAGIQMAKEGHKHAA